jgi:hypothetical protein
MDLPKLLEDLIEEVKDERTFVAFLQALADDKRFDGSEWYYEDIDYFLQGSVAWAKASRDGIEDYKAPRNAWRRIADILYHGRAKGLEL